MLPMLVAVLGSLCSTPAAIRRLIRQMAQENPTWGAPRIHGELLKLGYVVGERTVSRYLARIRPQPTKPRSQSWATFLKNHAHDIVAVDMFVVPTIRFQVLYFFIILGLDRRRLVFANVTANPTAEWLAQQIVNAFPWDTAPRFLIRDRDRAYGLAFSARVRGLGIREIRTAVGAPQMNAFAERVIGTLRRECFDHLIVLSERHAQRLLAEFRDWYNQDRLHLALGKDAPDHRPMSRPSSATLSPFPVSAVSTIAILVARPEAPPHSCDSREPCETASETARRTPFPKPPRRPPRGNLHAGPCCPPLVSARPRPDLCHRWAFGERQVLGEIPPAPPFEIDFLDPHMIYPILIKAA